MERISTRLSRSKIRPGGGGNASISDNGNVVAFVSEHPLIKSDGNDKDDIYLWSAADRRVRRISVGIGGADADGKSYRPAVSSTGRYIVFFSHADNLVQGDKGFPNIFVHDQTTGVTDLVGVTEDGSRPNSLGGGPGFRTARPDISADGRYVAFVSAASNLVAGDTNGALDVFVKDRMNDNVSRVSVSSEGVQGNNWSTGPSISYDGSKIAFTSRASNLVVADTNGAFDVFVHDLPTGTTERASVSSQGLEGNGDSLGATLTADGGVVVFSSGANNLVLGDSQFFYSKILARDLAAGTTTRVSEGPDEGGNQFDAWQADISGDGRWVSFLRQSPSGDRYGSLDHALAYIRDLLTGDLFPIASERRGTKLNPQEPVRVATGRGGPAVVFTSPRKLVKEDDDERRDVYLWRLVNANGC